MRQVLQSLKSGRTSLVEVPAPAVRSGHVLVRTLASVVSIGTERMLVEFGRAGWIDKARGRPEKVRRLFDKLRADGVGPAVDAVRAKLEAPVPMGYCNAGVVLAVGDGVPELRVGDRVASNGAHAELVVVPHRLCAKIPDEVATEDAAWTVPAAIALQGMRLVEPTLGEAIAVVGLGPIGLCAVQLLQAAGCRVLGVDLRADRCGLAEQYGATVACLSRGDDVEAVARTLTRGRGLDAALLTLATQSDEPVHQAAELCRRNGRLVLVGVAGLKLRRADFYAKELSFRVSCSYGPGRYDPSYERDGHDYPVGFVRWTEQRNFEAVLDLMAAGRLEVDALVSHRVPLADVESFYAALGRDPSVLGALIEYPRSSEPDLRRTITTAHAPRPPGRAGIAMLGAGNFAARVLAPHLTQLPASLETIVSAGGVTGTDVARRFGFRRSSTDPETVFADPHVDAVVVATRHDAHARYCGRALAAGKAVWVEKPLALTHAELDRLDAAHRAASRPWVMVGFNRRFAPQVRTMKRLLDGVSEPKSFVYTVNAGAIPADVWVHDRALGGGRIVGEACHFIDLLRHLVGAPITAWQVATVGAGSGLATTDDRASITLTFADGSLGTVHYLAGGSRAFPKERLEVFVADRTLQLGDFKTLRGWGWPDFRKEDLRKQDKGHRDALAAFVNGVRRGGVSPMDWGVLMEVARVTVDIADAARGGGGAGLCAAEDAALGGAA